MRQTTVFEGWYDQEPGWEFDMPVYMVKPILGYTDSAGSGPAGVDELIEEYLISRFMQLDANGKAIGTDEDFVCHLEEDTIRTAKRQFGIAKSGKAREGVFYWRTVVEWDDEDESHHEVIEEISYNRQSFGAPLAEV